jgi:hypothetical protein
VGAEELGISATFSTQSPSDITSINVISIPLNITYNVTGTNATPYLFFKPNSTTQDGLIYINGTLQTAWETKACTNTTALTGTINWLCVLYDNQIYPGTYNFNELYSENTTHSSATLSNTNQYVSMQFYNVSATNQYAFFEVMWNNSQTNSGSGRIYYCNSSYSTGDPASSLYCTLIATQIANQPYNHTHTPNSSHRVYIIPLNGTTGKMNSISVTSTSYFLLRGANNGWRYYYIANTSRANAYQTSSNNGASWTPQTFTIDAHIHQFTGNDSLNYYLNVSNTTSAIRSDLYQLAGLPPSEPQVITPTNTTYASGSTINISYEQSYSPNGYAISHYNISLFYPNYTFVKVLTANNSLALSYAWDTAATADGEYIVGVYAYDNLSQSSVAYSEPFILGFAPTSVVIN